VRAWSAGCSYGAEAYTLAAVCRDAIPNGSVRILGTDIDHRMVARAKLAEFSEADARSAPRAAMERWFERTPTGWRAKPALRSMATFEVGDLLKLRPPGSSYELIMCRNTVIYFADAIRDELHARFAHALAPGGLLVIGGTERISDAAALGLRPVQPFIYRKS
jgi:chemotaxis protein methyltransferase CheR